jgi:protoheme IX farnesyltransferase
MSDAVTLTEPTFSSITKDYLDLSKARIVMLVLITTAAGYLIGDTGPINWVAFFHALFGTALVAAGTNALNQYVEREHDRKMKRTRLRPVPDGRISPRAALFFSAAIAILGTLYLGLATNWLTAGLGALTLVSYIFVYTPMKRVTNLCTIVGAIPGAIPPVMGWVAATGSIDPGAWLLFAILFFWQMPHFMAISWIYREDYARGGFAMLAVEDKDGSATARQAVIWALALLPISLVPYQLHIAGAVYFFGALLGGIAFIAAAFAFWRRRDNRSAKKLFMVSNLYLMTVMILLVVSARMQ